MNRGIFQMSKRNSLSFGDNYFEDKIFRCQRETRFSIGDNSFEDKILILQKEPKHSVMVICGFRMHP